MIYWKPLYVQLDLEIAQSILIVIFRHMSIVCFNQLLLKRNFISWKRAIQIQFNLSRLEDWCRERLGAFGMDQEAIDAFGPLLQAVKVIQLAKTRGVDSGSYSNVHLIYHPCKSGNYLQATCRMISKTALSP